MGITHRVEIILAERTERTVRNTVLMVSCNMIVATCDRIETMATMSDRHRRDVTPTRAAHAKVMGGTTTIAYATRMHSLVPNATRATDVIVVVTEIIIVLEILLAEMTTIVMVPDDVATVAIDIETHFFHYCWK